MAELKTKETDFSVNEFLNAIADLKTQSDCREILKMMSEVTNAEPKMWGTSIVGFGTYHYKYESGREGDWFLSGFSPRKQNITLYILAGFDQYPEIIKNLGKFKNARSCLYVKRLEDIDRSRLRQLIELSVRAIKNGNKAQLAQGS